MKWFDQASLIDRRALAPLLSFALFASAGTGLAMAAGEFEPNDNLEQTAGPLAGGTWHTATLESATDQDWYRFYVRGKVEFRISGEGLSGQCGGSDSHRLHFLDQGSAFENAPYLGFESGAVNTIDRRSIRGADRLVLMADSPAGSACQYRIRIDPAEAVVSNEACGQALVDRRRVAKRLKHAKKVIKKASSKKRKRRFHRLIKRLRLEREQAEVGIAGNC